MAVQMPFCWVTLAAWTWVIPTTALGHEERQLERGQQLERGWQREVGHFEELDRP